MKRLWFILFITTFISLAWGQSHCHVFGKIKFVEYGEDYKVKFVEYGEDLNIKYVSYGEPQVGNWKTVEYGEKYKIKVVDYGEDFSVKLVDYGEGCNTSGSSSSSSITSEQVRAAYDPLIEAIDNEDGDGLEKGYEEGRQMVAELKKTRSGTIILYIMRAVILYALVKGISYELSTL